MIVALHDHEACVRSGAHHGFEVVNMKRMQQLFPASSVRRSGTKHGSLQLCFDGKMKHDTVHAFLHLDAKQTDFRSSYLDHVITHGASLVIDSAPYCGAGVLLSLA